MAGAVASALRAARLFLLTVDTGQDPLGRFFEPLVEFGHRIHATGNACQRFL